MIRTLAVAAAAAAVGYTLGQRASEERESRFERDRPTESGVGVGGYPEDVAFEDGEIGLSDDLTIHNPYTDWEEFDEDGRVGR